MLHTVPTLAYKGFLGKVQNRGAIRARGFRIVVVIGGAGREGRETGARSV